MVDQKQVAHRAYYSSLAPATNLSNALLTHLALIRSRFPKEFFPIGFNEFSGDSARCQAMPRSRILRISSGVIACAVRCVMLRANVVGVCACRMPANRNAAHRWINQSRPVHKLVYPFRFRNSSEGVLILAVLSDLAAIAGANGEMPPTIIRECHT